MLSITDGAMLLWIASEVALCRRCDGKCRRDLNTMHSYSLCSLAVFALGVHIICQITSWHEDANPLDNFSNLVAAVDCVPATCLARRRAPHSIHASLRISYTDLGTNGHFILFAFIVVIRSINLYLYEGKFETAHISNLVATL